MVSDAAEGGDVSRYRLPTKSSKYYLPREEYITAVHWCLRYPAWVEELSIEPDTVMAIRYDVERVQTSPNYDATYETAARRAAISQKKEMLEEIISSIAPEIYRYLLLGVAYGRTEYQLRDMGMPCGHRYYSERRQRVYYEIAKRI